MEESGWDTFLMHLRINPQGTLLSVKRDEIKLKWGVGPLVFQLRGWVGGSNEQMNHFPQSPYFHGFSEPDCVFILCPLVSDCSTKENSCSL